MPVACKLKSRQTGLLTKYLKKNIFNEVPQNPAYTSQEL